MQKRKRKPHQTKVRGRGKLTALKPKRDSAASEHQSLATTSPSYLLSHLDTTTTKMSTITTTALQTSYPPLLPNSFNANQPKTIRLYPLSNYTFGTKETQPEEDPSVLA